MSRNDKGIVGKSLPRKLQFQRHQGSVAAAAKCAKQTAKGTAITRRAYSTRKTVKQGTVARVRSKSLSQPTCLDASRKIRTPRELRSSERTSPTPAAPPVVVSQKHGQSTARYTRRAVVPQRGPIRNSQVEVSLPREKRRAAAARGAGSGRSNNGGGGTQAEKSLMRKTRRGAAGGVRSGGNNGGGGGVPAASVATSFSTPASAASASAATSSSTSAPSSSSSTSAPSSSSTSAPSSASSGSVATSASSASSAPASSFSVPGPDAATGSAASAAAAAAAAASASASATRKSPASRMAGAPQGAQNREKKARPTPGKLVSEPASAPKKQWGRRLHSPRNCPILTAPKIRNSTSPASTQLRVTTALSSSSESSSGTSDDDDDEELGCGFGAEGRSADTVTLGIGGPPLPPKTRTEMSLEAWAVTRRAGRPAKGKEALNPEYRYPTLMVRIRESARVTVRKVCAASRGSGSSSIGGDGGSSSSGGIRVKQATVTGSEKREEGEPKEALIEFRLAKKGLVQDLSGMFLALGLEVAGTPGKTPAGTPARGGRGTATFPVVSSVTAGGYAENWGVTSGIKIIEVGRASMEGKRSAADINKALENLKRNNNVIDNTKYMKAVNGPPSRVVFSIPQPPTPPGWNQAPSAVGGKHEGGMAFLGLKMHRGRDFTELCWSVNLSKDQGALPDAKIQLNGIGLTYQENSVVSRILGFDVERRCRPHGLQYIQVTSVTPGTLAARHGLRVNDMLLAVDGLHLLSHSTFLFWQHLVDRIRGGETHPQKSNQGRDKHYPKSNQGRGMHSLRSRQGRDKHPPKSSWLRFLLARKRVPPAVSTACADETIAVKNISQKAPTAISSGRMPPGRKKNSEREGGVEGGMRGGCLPPPASDMVCPSKRPRPSADEPAPAAPGVDSQRARPAQTSRTSRSGTCRRPDWWGNYVRGSHRCILKLRPANALHGVTPGGPAVRGAFVLEDLNLGGTVIPCGSQLVAVNDKTTKDMEFEAARALAMTGTLGSVLRFE